MSNYCTIKKPILLPSKDHVVLCLQKEHSRLFHTGAQAVLSNVRIKFWPRDYLREIKRIARKCGLCFRFLAQLAQPLMRYLLDIELPSRDHFKDWVLFTRDCSRQKLRDCEDHHTSAHIQIVSDLSTVAFTATLRRFKRAQDTHQRYTVTTLVTLLVQETD